MTDEDELQSEMASTPSPRGPDKSPTAARRASPTVPSTVAVFGLLNRYSVAAWFLAFSGLAIVAAAAWKYGHSMGGLSGQPNDWGAFGSYFSGMAGTLISLMALIGIALTLSLQEKQLSRNALAHTEQLSAAQKETFEGTLFRLLGRYDEIRQAIRHEDKKLFGSDALERHFADLSGTISADVGSGKAGCESVVDRSKQFADSTQGYLGHYFRVLYHVFAWIDGSHLTRDDKINYANVCRAQLSRTELLLLFHNGLVGEGKEGFLPLIERYGLLKHLKAGFLPLPDSRTSCDFYNDDAFSDAGERAERYAAGAGSQFGFNLAIAGDVVGRERSLKAVRRDMPGA